MTREDRPHRRSRIGRYAVVAVALCALGFGAGAVMAQQASAGGGADDTGAPTAAHVRMVEQEIRDRGIRDERVLRAMLDVPRHKFVPTAVQEEAYGDGSLPIGEGQTITQPYVVAHMTEALELAPDARVLEVGTGSGYQAAILAEIAAEVYTIEIVPELAERAAEVLDAIGYDNVYTRLGDGYRGWPEAAPFDGIVVTAAPDEVPAPLVEQLAVGGRLVIPVGKFVQTVRVITKTADGVNSETTIPVRFVPMTGEVQK